MRIYISFLSTLFILSCSVSKMNSIDKNSFPENTQFQNITDSITVTTYDILGQNYNNYFFTFRYNNEPYYIETTLLDDTIIVYEFSKRIDSIFYFSGCFENKKPCYSKPTIISQNNLNKTIEEKLTISIQNNSIVFDKGGKTYNEIIDQYHVIAESYYLQQMKLFMEDTMSIYTADNYTSKFKYRFSSSEKIENVLKSIIGYYGAFPERMALWPSHIKKNMEFLILHLNLNALQLYNQMEVSIEQNNLVQMRLF